MGPRGATLRGPVFEECDEGTRGSLADKVLQDEHKIGRALLRLALAGVLPAVTCASLAGCKTSDVLTELLVDQNSNNVDEDSSSRFLENMLTALNLTEELPQLDNADTDLERDRTEQEAVDGEHKQQEQAAKAEYDNDASANGKAEVDSGDDQGATTEDSGKKQGDSSSGGDKRSDKRGKESKADDKKGDGDDGGNKGDQTVYRGDGGSGTVYNEDGSYDDLPSGVQTVVAFGECANMVVSFAGEHALAGADKDFLSNSFIKSAYKTKDINNAKTVKTAKDGTIDADYVAKLKPDALLLMGSSYKLSDAGKAKLKEANVDVVYLPAMSSATRICKVAKSIGQMFGKDTLSGDDVQQAASVYVDWHDDLVKSVKETSGGLAGQTNFDTGESVDGTTGNYTLYVSQWDNATYTATPDDHKSWTDANGVAISTVGYKWSPMSYYLSVGGTQNVSATFKAPFYDVQANYYVWQFNLGRVPSVYDKNWKGRTVSVGKLSNSGTSDLLVKASDGTTLGSSNYSYVIARTQKIAAKLEKSRDAGTKKQQGLYAVYKDVGGGGMDKGGRGFMSKTGQYCSAAISGSYSVKVNPSGLYSSWINGSPESALEAVWIADVNNGTSKLSSEIKNYYKLFYGYKLSKKQVSAIETGAQG